MSNIVRNTMAKVSDRAAFDLLMPGFRGYVINLGSADAASRAMRSNLIERGVDPIRVSRLIERMRQSK